jgi:CBS domain-containing protein
MSIRNVMTELPVTCGADDTLEDATELMCANDIGFLPILDHSDALVGVITDCDALRAAYAHGKPLCGLLVETAMTRHVVTCTVHDDIAEVRRRMAKHRIRRMPVVERGRLLGVVGLSDLVHASQRVDQRWSRAA